MWSFAKMIASVIAAIKKPAIRRYGEGTYGDWKYGSSTK